MNTEIEGQNQGNLVKSSHSPEVFFAVKETKDNVGNALENENIKISPEEIEEVLKEKEAKIRVSLIRHYPHEKGEDLDRYNELIEKLEFGHTDTEKVEFHTLSNKIPCYSEFDKVEPKELISSLENIFSQRNTIVIFDDTEKSSKRVINSAKDLKSEKMRKRFPNLVFVSEGINLPGSDKTKSFDEDLTVCAVTFGNLIKRIKNEFIKNEREIQNIVILGNRSYCQGFLNAQENEKISPYSAVKQLEKDGYLYIEYNSEKRLIKNQKNQILVTPKNYKDLVKKFRLDHSSIIDFQNKLNVCFIKGIYKYKVFLDSDNEYLKTFCLANLIQQQEYSVLEGYYLSDSCKELSDEEKTLILQNTQDSRIKTLLRKLFVSREALWNDEESGLFSKEGQTEFYDLLKQTKLVYKKVLALQGNSLDPLIKNGNKKAILERKLYFEEEQESENKQDFEENDNRQNKVLVRKTFDPDLFHKGGKYPKFIIRAHVGEGKSMYLSEFVKNFSLEQSTEIQFAQAKDFDDNLDLLDVLFDNADIFVCIDALDEAKAETREKIKSLFNSFGGRCIITTRHSEFFNSSEKICTMYFDSIDTDTYIESRFSDDKIKEMEVKKWIEGQGLANEIKGNPLLLNLIVLLASTTDKDKDWMEKYEISPYKEIKTKADLYENAVRFVLAKHKGAIKNKTMLEMCMDRLAQHAFDIFSDNKNPKIDPDLFDENLSILFKGTEGGKYDFIHKSFYEFFLAKYLSKMPKNEGSQKIYDFRDQKKFGNWNDWRDFCPVVLFYGEMLAKDEKWDEIEKFLGEEGLMKGDDMFGESFFMGLEILYKLPEEARKKPEIAKLSEEYIKKVKNWDIGEVLKRLELTKRFVRTVGYSDNEVTKIIISKIKDKPEIITKIATPLAIKIAIGMAKKMLEKEDFYNALYVYKLLVDNENPKVLTATITGVEELLQKEGNYGAGEFYEILAESKNPLVIQTAIDRAKILVQTMEFCEAGEMYKIFAESEDVKTAYTAIKGAELLMGEEEFLCAGRIYKALAKNRNMHVLSIIELGARRLLEKKEFSQAGEIYKVLASNSNTNTLDVVLSGIEMLLDANISLLDTNFFNIKRIYEQLANNSNPKAIRFAGTQAKLLLTKRRYYEAASIYKELAGNENSEAINTAKWGAKMLLKNREFDRSIWIFENLARNKNNIAIHAVIVEAVKVFLQNKDFNNVERLYEAFVGNEDPEIQNTILFGIDVLLEKGRIDEAGRLYIKFIYTGNKGFIEGALHCLYEYLEKESKYNTWETPKDSIDLCKSLAKLGDREVIKQALEIVQNFRENKKMSGYLSHQLLTILDTRGPKERILDIARKFNGRLSPNNIIELINIGDPETMNQALESTKILKDNLFVAIDKGDDSYEEEGGFYGPSSREQCASLYEILEIYIKLISTYKQEVVNGAKELIRKSIQIGELDTSIELIETLRAMNQRFP
ncbi:hypothetical protein COW06_03255 [Candidatus Gracilibacteria bacterium CG12_big_fil_rev_8_21_14_0_65_38_15]|nr:MAG: hypothetical protein COW68_00890 [Candidatus Gracilibacteria bacterium CG18_big_fil_WC_8_21_14_2_50_38_16]PIQ41303.1 MAG: hypothetical protein COW06_03255 [Candidatus Gracilibacteria bacterium CG12_big_fil_rev_8_21_14_0_65_38_15]